MPPIRLCLNMIVRDERAIIERCLASVAPWISAWTICDTGSTDGTQAVIEAFFARAGIPGLLVAAPFIDFSQARNAALDAARDSTLAFDALLLADADMELVVEDPGFATSLTGAACHLRQRAAISYWNLRLLRRDAPARYVGATHEYLDVTGPGARCDGAWFIDHANGSSRPSKIARDTTLLEGAVAADPADARSWFYLAQTYRDGGRERDAAAAYATRAALGGWPEEAWHARWQQARCQLRAGEEQAFVSTALTAYAARPWRAEPLYDLAKYWRERGDNDAALLFAEHGMAIAYPREEQLFVEDHVYQTGLVEEAAIAGYHSADAARRARGRVLCEALALDRSASDEIGTLARRNAGWYAAREDWAAGQAVAALPDGVVIEGLARAGNGILALSRAGGTLTLSRLDASLCLVASRALTGASNAVSLAERAGRPVLVRRLGGGLLLVPLTDEGGEASPTVVLGAASDATVLDLEPVRCLVGLDPWRVQDGNGGLCLDEAPPWRMGGMTRGGASLAFAAGCLVLTRESEELGEFVALFTRFCWVDGGGHAARLSLRAGCIDAVCWHPDGEHLVVAGGGALRRLAASAVARQLGL